MVDLDAVRELLVALEFTPREERLAALERTAIDTGGTVNLPKPGYRPVIASIEVFEVFAMAEDPAALPANWTRVARNILEAAGGTAAGSIAPATLEEIGT